VTLIGIDHGTRRSGIAIELAGIALPRAIVATDALHETLRKIIDEYSVTAIVVGRAPHLNSSKQSSQEQIQEIFCQNLAQKFPEITIISHPEGFSTQQARFELERAGLQSTGPVDDQAAAIILQDYLDTH
jgi:putative transcription antitermination factor YqgF